MRCRNINRGLIHLLRLECRSRGTTRLSIECYLRGLVSDDRTFGLEVVASLDRRRTSTVNDGTARLNVVLDTAYDSADSSRPWRPCEAMRSKAIADYCGGEQPVVPAAPPNSRDAPFRAFDG